MGFTTPASGWFRTAGVWYVAGFTVVWLITSVSGSFDSRGAHNVAVVPDSHCATRKVGIGLMVLRGPRGAGFAVVWLTTSQRPIV